MGRASADAWIRTARIEDRLLRRIHDLARRVTATRRATFGLHRASLTQLAVRFAAEEMARLGVAPATALGAEAVAARASSADRYGRVFVGTIEQARGRTVRVRSGSVACRQVS